MTSTKFNFAHTSRGTLDFIKNLSDVYDSKHDLSGLLNNRKIYKSLGTTRRLLRGNNHLDVVFFHL